jgi:hypothetical protein
LNQKRRALKKSVTSPIYHQMVSSVGYIILKEEEEDPYSNQPNATSESLNPELKDP